MAAQEKRLITSHTSKLGKANLINLLSDRKAWDDVPMEDRERLYAQLPKMNETQPDAPLNVHPLDTIWRPYIERALREWQDDLVAGYEEKKWRAAALEASRERKAGKWTEWEAKVKEDAWGSKVESLENGDEVENGDGVEEGDAVEEGDGVKTEMMEEEEKQNQNDEKDEKIE